ncbi:MAG: Npt1/Npt2 family nucleotide transporter, partial [Thermoanaerobaculia bacterium]|nr:Npt1/Npt2 family nucleotide transporter [Thermoanaerobaculia bacterium]
MAAHSGHRQVAGWRRALRQLGVDLRSGEGEPALLLFAFLFLLLTFQISTETVRQSTFIDSLGAARLPWVYLLVAVTSYPFLLLYDRFVGRHRVEHLLVRSCWIVAALLLVFWVLMRFPWSWVAIVYYVFTAITYGLLNSQFWLFANHLFDPRQAKRLFGLVGAGALLGGILGGQIARLVSQLVGTSWVLLIAAALLAAATGLVRRAARFGLAESDDDGAIEGLERAQSGFRVLGRSRLLVSITVLVVLTLVVGQIVDLQFNWAVEQTTTTLDERTAFFGNFFSVMGVAAFFFQLLFTARIHRTLGIAFAMRVLPVTIAIGTVALFVTAGGMPRWLIAAALVLKIGESGLRYSLDQATRELLFLPVPSELRMRAKAFIDVFVQRGAKGLAALLLLPVTFGVMSAVQAGWISLVLVVAWLVVIGITAREYVGAFRSGLKGQTVETAIPVDLSDMTTLELLVESLGSSDSRQVLHSLDILVSNDRGRLVPPLLLYHDDPEVRRRTLAVLAKTERLDAMPLVERTLRDPDADVRAEAVRVLAGLQGTDATELMLPKLEEADPGVRAAAVACLANYGDEAMVDEASRVLLDLLRDADLEVRCEAAKAIGAVHEPRFQDHLIRLLYDPEREVVGEAIAAIRRRVARDGFNPLYVPTLISLLQNRRVRHEARGALVAFGEDALPAMVHFMGDPDEPLWVRRALPKAISAVDTPAAAEALLDGLEEAADSFQRRKLVEALGAARDGRALARQHLDRVGSEIAREAEAYLDRLAGLDALGLRRKGGLQGALVVWDGEQSPTLLDRLLGERSTDNLKNLFGLLALIYPAGEMHSAHRSLTSADKLQRSRSLEFLDNRLDTALKRDVFAVIDDCPLGEKLERARRRYGIERGGRRQVLRRLLRYEESSDPEAGTLAAAALYTVHIEQVEGLTDEIERLSGAEEP